MEDVSVEVDEDIDDGNGGMSVEVESGAETVQDLCTSAMEMELMELSQEVFDRVWRGNVRVAADRGDEEYLKAHLMREHASEVVVDV
jgi:hypothetical protein